MQSLPGRSVPNIKNTFLKKVCIFSGRNPNDDLYCAGHLFCQRWRRANSKSIHPLGYSEIVEREAQNYHIDPLLVYSVIKAESNFDADAVSNAGAMGLMQIMPETYEWLASKEGITDVSQEDLLNPEINIKYGCMFLSILLERYPQLSSAVAAYNAGFGNVDNWLEDITIAPDGEHLEHIPFPRNRTVYGKGIEKLPAVSKII